MKRSIIKISAVLLVLMLILTGTFSVFAESQPDSDSSQIDVDGIFVNLSGRNINGNNYFRLRDIANALNDTVKNFQVTYDETEDRVIIEKGRNYEPDNGKNEESGVPGGDVITEGKSEVYLDGIPCELKSYNVNGYNYVKLRDVAELIDFALYYYSETNSVSFVTGKTYSESEEFYPETGETVSFGENELYSLDIINEYSMYFNNYVDGYRVMIPEDMKVDMSINEFRTVLENDSLRIEIYRQPLSSSDSYNSYVNYGNKAVLSASFCNIIKNGTISVGGRSTHLLEWYRNPLKRIENDRCYYACADINIGSNQVLTFLFKSSVPFTETEGVKSYKSILDTLKMINAGAESSNKKTTAVKNQHWNEETAELFEEWFSEESELTWGIFEPMAPVSFENLDTKERLLAHNFDLMLYYSDVNTGLAELETALTNANEKGRTVELTFQTSPRLDGKGSMMLDMLDGRYDDFLNRYAQIVADSERPVLFRLCNEMNGDWCVYSGYNTSKDTELYKEFYKYVYSIFEKNGALKNTIWVWNPNEKSFPNYYWNHALCYYPGDEYVDVVGMTGYNTGTYYSSESWRSFKTIYDGLYYQYCAWFSQPLMITEFSCSGNGGNKAGWVRDMLSQIDKYSGIKAAVWWDGCDFDSEGNIARSYFISDDPEVVNAFRNYFTSSD